MTYSSAYLFAKQLTAGQSPDPPIGEGVYFENGRFNPLYVPQGFDFHNNQHKLQRVQDDWPYFNRISFPEGDLDDGSVIMLQTHSSQNIYVDGEYFGMNESGYLTLSHHVEPYSQQSWMASYWQYIILPIVNIERLMNGRPKLCISYRALSNTEQYECDIFFENYIKLSSTQIETGMYLGWEQTVDLPQDWDTIKDDISGYGIPETDFLVYCINVREFPKNPMDLEFQINKIWAEE